MKLDEYKYEKSNQQYFESMPTIGLFDSQIIFINNYIEILEKKNDEKATISFAKSSTETPFI